MIAMPWADDGGKQSSSPCNFDGVHQGDLGQPRRTSHFALKPELMRCLVIHCGLCLFGKNSDNASIKGSKSQIARSNLEHYPGPKAEEISQRRHRRTVQRDARD